MNPIKEGNPVYSQEYVELITCLPYKTKSQRTEQVSDRLSRRLYVDGFTTLDINGSYNVEEQLESIKSEVLHFLSRKGPVQQVFAKLKREQVLIFADFQSHETLEAWMREGHPYPDPRLGKIRRLVKMGDKQLSLTRESAEVDSSLYKISSIRSSGKSKYNHSHPSSPKKSKGSSKFKTKKKKAEFFEPTI